MFDGAPIVEITAEFLADVHPSLGEALFVVHGKDGDVRYRVVDWDAQRMTFTIASPSGEAILKKHAERALREGLCAIAERRPGE